MHLLFFLSLKVGLGFVFLVGHNQSEKYLIVNLFLVARLFIPLLQGMHIHHVLYVQNRESEYECGYINTFKRSNAICVTLISTKLHAILEMNPTFSPVLLKMHMNLQSSCPNE